MYEARKTTQKKKTPGIELMSAHGFDFVYV